MKNINYISIAFLIAILILFSGCGRKDIDKDDARLKIVVSFFPMEQFARNIVGNVQDVKIKTLLPPGQGCPHDYYLTLKDMNTAAWGNVFIINGLGLEEFSEKTIKTVNEDIEFIDSSEGIEPIVDNEHEKSVGHAHHHRVNPHLFSSPRQAAMQVRTIVRRLSETDTINAEIYRANGEAFAGLLDSLADSFREIVANADNRKIVTVHNVFDYLAQDTGLEIIAVLDSEPGQEPSAGKLLELIDVVKAEKPAAILIEPQYSAKAAEAISKETGVPLFTLDPVASGPVDAPMNYYVDVMKKNLETLRQALKSQ